MGELTGGGGIGRVNNVVFEEMKVSDVEWAVLITQCYAQKDPAKCHANPTRLALSNIIIRDVSGTTSKKHDPLVGSLICGDPEICQNIQVSNINVRAPSGGRPFECRNIDNNGLKVICR